MKREGRIRVIEIYRASATEIATSSKSCCFGTSWAAIDTVLLPHRQYMYKQWIIHHQKCEKKRRRVREWMDVAGGRKSDTLWLCQITRRDEILSRTGDGRLTLVSQTATTK